MSEGRIYYVYILASRKHGTLYTGITNNLAKRVCEHKGGTIKGFTKKYNVKNLVYFEEYMDVNEAIQREMCIKEWKRAWKIELIETINENWNDLYKTLV